MIFISTVFIFIKTVSVDTHTPVSSYLLPITKNGNENKAKIENKTENENENQNGNGNENENENGNGNGNENENGNGKELCGVQGEVGVLCNGVLCRSGHPLYGKPGESIWEVNVKKLKF